VGSKAKIIGVKVHFTKDKKKLKSDVKEYEYTDFYEAFKVLA